MDVLINLAGLFIVVVVIAFFVIRFVVGENPVEYFRDKWKRR